jgi:hypothetical protein
MGSRRTWSSSKSTTGGLVSSPRRLSEERALPAIGQGALASGIPRGRRIGHAGMSKSGPESGRIPWLQGKLQGKNSISADFGKAGPKNPVVLAGFAKVPYSAEQGIF